MPGFSFLRRFTGNTVSSAAGFGVGAAMSPALQPLTQELANETWSANPSRPLPAAEAAALRVRGLASDTDAAAEAKRQGYNAGRFANLRSLAETFPGLPDLLDLWRRERITRADVLAALRRQGFSETWAERLATLTTYLLPPSDVIRLAVHEVYDPAKRDALNLDAEFPAEFGERAALLGITERDARDLWAGHWDLPSYGQAAQMLFRKVIDRPTFQTLLAALDYAPTWRGPLEQIARAIPTMTDFQRLARREVYNAQQRAELDLDKEFPPAFADKAALHGLSEQDARDLWAGGWRLPSATQGFHMLWRGEIDERQLGQLLKALDYAPTWRDKLANIARPTPGRIDLRRMLQAGIITRAEAIAGYQKLGYTRQDATDLVGLAATAGATTAKGLTAADLAAEYEGLLITRAEYVAGLREIGYNAEAAEAKADVADNKRARDARNALIGTARTRFIGWRIDQVAAEQALRDADVPAAQASDLLARWTVERELNVHHLTEAQVIAAYKKALLTRDGALERLLDLGLDPEDALIRLGGDPRNLSVTDIVKAYVSDLITRDDAIARLVAIGFTSTDAALRLDTAKA